MRVICVDLDGTLIQTDTTWMATCAFLRAHPLRCWQLLGWLWRGRAYLKQRLAQKIYLDPLQLTYHTTLIEWLKTCQQSGDTLVLATATDQVFAHAIAAHLGIFSQVIASDGQRNLRAHHKAAVLSQHFGLKGYTYVGNSRDDLAVWREAKTAIVVNASERLEKQVRAIAVVENVF